MYSRSKVEDDKNYKRQQSAPSFRKKAIKIKVLYAYIAKIVLLNSKEM